ncbi:DUF1028 domain-containing protein [Haloplanus natans]|uniref:DUF1028 domain-containing protein n=1 Tax=Haloplanus natans TaxID=376171 RepID=UPI0006779EB5|nr:DUF1028 domain-containing protein [Haloplanus natans]
MTFSICVRERGAAGYRFGVAAAARVPAVGSVCPHVSDAGAVAVAGVTDADAGRRLLDAVAGGDRVADAMAATGDPRTQRHGVGVDSAGAHTGADCRPVAAGRVGDGYTVAGTSLAEEGVLDALAQGYRENERDAPLVRRLITALAAGARAGGDDRDLPVGSAAVAVRTGTSEPLYHDLRVDAAETPVADLRETYRRAKHGYDAAVDRYTENS